jgi:hypothetical protein
MFTGELCCLGVYGLYCLMQERQKRKLEESGAGEEMITSPGGQMA